MPLTEIRKVCEVSLETPAEEQSKLHNRWHPDIPFADTIKNGVTVKIECVRCLAMCLNQELTRVQVDWTGGQIGIMLGFSIVTNAKIAW
jgi:formamidase